MNEEQFKTKIIKGPHLRYEFGIKENGDFVMEVYDYMPRVLGAYGGSDHEHTVTIHSEDKDALLIALIHDRFSDVEPLESEGPFENWLSEKNVKHKTFCRF